VGIERNEGAETGVDGDDIAANRHQEVEVEATAGVCIAPERKAVVETALVIKVVCLSLATTLFRQLPCAA
jgi:hypothetical protein